MTVKAKTEDLEAFLAVVDSGSFSAAAILLNQQVAKVSRAVARLEATLNFTLLNRTTRRLELTEEGQIFIVHVREGLTVLAKGEEALKLLNSKPSGKLRIDAVSPFIIHQLTPIIKQFTQVYPDITLDITTHDRIIDLLEHKTDVAIRIGDMKDSNLHARLLGRSRLHMVATPEYLANAPQLNQMIDLLNHKLIGFTDSPKLNDWFLNENINLKFSMLASSGETIRQLCLADQGIAVLSNFMIRKDINAGRLIEVLPETIKTPNRRESIQAVYYRNSAVSSRISVFLDFIKPRLAL